MSNLSAREALERAQQLFRQQPPASQKNHGPPTTTTAIWRDGLRCEATHPDGHKIITDMARTYGGSHSGPSPGWLLRASLASCTATAIAMRSAIRGIELRRLEVSVHGEVDIRAAVGIDGTSLDMTGLRMLIAIGAVNAEEAELREIAEWAAMQSTVSSTLREQPAFEVSVV